MDENNADSGETIPEFIFKEPIEIVENDSKEKYFIYDIVKVGNFNFYYKGNRKKTKKDICMKPLSINGYHMIKDVISFIKLEPGKSKVFLNIIDVFISEHITKTYFLVMDGTLVNLSTLIVTKDTIKDCDNFFLKHSLRAVKYLHKNGYIHGNLSSKSFWVKFNQTVVEQNGTKTFIIEEIVLADLEYCSKYKDCENDSEIKKISEQRITSRPRNYRYCALGLHNGEKLCMKFDFESIFYILVEIFEEKLPWDSFPDNEDFIKREKEDMREPTYDFFKNTPEHLAEIICFIDKKNPKEIPNSDDIKKRFYHYKKKQGFYDQDRYTLGDSDYTRIASGHRYERILKEREEEAERHRKKFNLEDRRPKDILNTKKKKNNG